MIELAGHLLINLLCSNCINYCINLSAKVKSLKKGGLA